MRRHALIMFAVALATLMALGSALGEHEGLTSLRGMHELQDTAPAPDLKQWQHDQKPIERAFVQQPPLIPHQIEGYQINANFNKCLSCHSWSNARESGATKVSLTHFKNRDGIELSDIAPRRYFCTQCHVPQIDARPLVENTFEPIDTLAR